MDNLYLAKLVAPNIIHITYQKPFIDTSFSLFLLIDHKDKEALTYLQKKNDKGESYLEITLSKPLELGHSYFLELPSILIPLDVSKATSFPDFDENFSYDGPLGAICNKEETNFYLFAPLASSVLLYLYKDEELTIYPLKRGEKGVYALTLKGNYEKCAYQYLVTNNEISHLTIDPYALASLPNASKSVLLNLNDFSPDLKRECLPPSHGLSDAIIYEGNVRDLTSDKSTDILHKGKYLGLIEKGRKTKKGNKAGFDYFTSLGFTHLQLMPIFDFDTIDELSPSKNYNWGYDPVQYFLPEGSYASNVSDPYSRINDLREMVKGYHEAGIRIVMDVVFNHVYDQKRNSLELTLPNYYFRKNADGSYKNESGCGNVLASERPMCRRLILDAIKHWMTFYGIDGFRFDLMGLIDIKTMQEVEKLVHSYLPDALLYGEGWKMDNSLPFITADMGNHSEISHVAFFNDFYRDTMKKALANNNVSNNDFNYCFLGSSLNIWPHNPKFSSLFQTINYLECHDDMTYFDYLFYEKGYNLAESLQRSKFALAVLLFSFGVPFIHAGEEIGLSKFGKRNTYNSGDAFNMFSYSLLDERKECSDYIKHCIALRKSLQFFQRPLFLSEDNSYSIEEFSGITLFKILQKSENQHSLDKEIFIFINRTNVVGVYDLKREAKILLMEGSALPKDMLAESIYLPKRSILLCAPE